MKTKKIWSALLLFSIGSTLLLPTACNPDSGSTGDYTDVTVTYKELSKEEYQNKTLAGILGQFAGFLSGYEFVWDGPLPYVGMPLEWFDFINGPYAGNYEYYFPGSYGTGDNIYDRLKVNPDTGRYEVASDDDYHIDIFNQTILDEYGYTSYDIKEAWKKYQVSDWGGGQDAMKLIASKDMLAPFTGTIEAGNTLGWCTEAYIENETLGMNAPGMPNLATELIDKFASNVGYYDSVIWAKFYGAMYSLAYFETDIKVVMEKALETMPEGSYPRTMYEKAVETYNLYPNDYKKAAQILDEARRRVGNIDNTQCDPNVNGAFAVLSWLYGKNDYMDTCMYASVMGYDADCTAAITQGVMGILKGFKPENEEYQKINEMIYYDGEGVYWNDRTSGFPPHIKNAEYFERIKIDDIVALYQKNFEKLLLANGGEIKEDIYLIPTTEVYGAHSYLFDNCDAETRTTEGFEGKNGKLESLVESDTGNSHSGYASIKFTNESNGEVWHTFDNLTKGKWYRFTCYAKTSSDVRVTMFAKGGEEMQSITFAHTDSPICKELIFQATDKTMKCGFLFDMQKKGEYVIFDDFYLEEIQREQLAEVSDAELSPYSAGYTVEIQKPENVKIGEEVILSVEYRNATGSVITDAKVYRNSKLFGGIVLSNTGGKSSGGVGVVEIPYVFESEKDVVKIDFNNLKVYVGEVDIYRQTQYLFR